MEVYSWYVRAGSNDLYSGNFSVSGRKENLDFLIGADHFREGYDQGASEIEITDTRSSSVNGKVRYENETVGGLEFRGEYRNDTQESESAFMGGLSDNTVDLDNFNTSLVWKRPVNDRLDVQLTGYYTDNFRTYESVSQGSPAPAEIDTTTDELVGFKSDFSLIPFDKVKVDFGLDLSSNDYENERLSASQNRKQTGLFTQVEMNLIENLILTLGGRYDDITEVGSYVSPRLSAMYTFNSGLKVRGTYGGGFRAPSFIELYSNFPIPIPGMPMMVVGNPDLDPEKSNGGNIGIEYLWKSRLLVNATGFYNKFEDMIVDYEAAPLTYSYLNVENATFRGVELQTRFYVSNNLTSTVSYNFTDIEQKDEDVAFSKISPHTASLRVTYGLFKNRLQISLRDQFFSERDILVVSGMSGSFSKEKKDPYNEVDLTLSYRLNRMFGLRLGATNLADYKDIEYGPYVGRRIFFALNTTFGKN